MKTFPGKQKLGEIVMTRPSLQEMLKNVLQVKMNTERKSNPYEETKILVKVNL